MSRKPSVVPDRASLGVPKAPSNEPLVRFDGVGLRYGRAAEIIKDASFALEPGSFTFLTGPSGAGKTSLLKLIYLALKPTRGLITAFGRDVTTLPRQDALQFAQRTTRPAGPMLPSGAT